MTHAIIGVPPTSASNALAQGSFRGSQRTMGTRRGRHSLSVSRDRQRCNGRGRASLEREGDHHAQHVVVGRPGGCRPQELRRRLGQEVRGAASGHQDQHHPAEHGQPRAGVRGGSRCQEGPGHRVLLGWHQHARGRLGRQHQADLRPAAEERVEALHQRQRGHLGRQALLGPLVHPALVPGALPQGRPGEGRHQGGSDHLDAADLRLQDAERQGHHPDGGRRQGRLVRRLALQHPRLAVRQLGQRGQGRGHRHARSSPTPRWPPGGRSSPR